MHNKKGQLVHARSYTGIYDIFGSTPFSNVLLQNQKKSRNDSAAPATVGDTSNNKIHETSLLNKSSLVTSEKYHGLNKELSVHPVFPSTSTIFYDLDDIAKRHSFHCLAEVSISNANILKVLNLPQRSGFEAKSDVIVQECATQLHPTILAKDSLKINSKKIKRKFLNNDVLSSEIFLRDERFGKHYRKNQYYNIDVTNRQKFWSYAKYRTEYTKPLAEEKKNKKKDKGKRTEDPCPCQLFSYACPCTDEKSLTELAKNSKCLTVVDQITSTTKIPHDKKKKQKYEAPREDKPTNTTVVESTMIQKPKNEPIIHVAHNEDIPLLADGSQQEKTSSRNRSSYQKKPRRVFCPNCKEKVDAMSITEEEDSLNSNSRFRYDSKEIESTAAYNCSTSSRSNRNKIFDDSDICTHDPRCELIPVCQILPPDDYSSSKGAKKRTSPKSVPRVIRITRACRHHPPCTVVPSCQRTNVLRNNCEFIPPCLHRPRCVNLPLCVPLSKSIHYDELGNKHVDDEENVEICPHVPRCKYIPVCQHDSVTNNVEHRYGTESRVHTACEYVSGFHPTPYTVNAKPAFVTTTPVPPQVIVANSCCKTNKSCQFNCSECKYKITSDIPTSSSLEGIVFIRDVGCQFQNKSYSPKDSILQSKTSSASFDYVDVKSGYYTNTRTVRYEDKFTNPISGGDSHSTDSVLSAEVDRNCPSHGRRSTKFQYSGFNPKTAYVAAFANTDALSHTSTNEKYKSKSEVTKSSTFSTKSRRNFVKGKYSKIFSSKRRRKAKPTPGLFINCISGRIPVNFC